MKKLSIFLILVVLLSNVSVSTGYDTNVVHPKINESALGYAVVDAYMKSQLGFNDGIKEVFEGKEVKEWLKGGGKEEDSGTRSNNHFHDPTKTWDQAGAVNGVKSSMLTDM